MTKEEILEGIAAKLFYQKFPPSNDALAYNFRWEDIPFDGCPSGKPFRSQAKAIYDFIEPLIQQAKGEKLCPVCQGEGKVLHRPARLIGATYPEDDNWRGDEHFEPCPVCKLIQQAREEVVSKVFEEIEEFYHKPHLYHYRCWASGTVLVEDAWGLSPTHQCRTYNGEYNCGCRKCPWEGGVIKGELELQDYERQRNYIIRDIVQALKAKSPKWKEVKLRTPEDKAAEKHFTPSTLTAMLKEGMLDPYPYPDAVDRVREIFKEWLRTVGLPQQMSEESTRQLLITLVDEPQPSEFKVDKARIEGGNG